MVGAHHDTITGTSAKYVHDEEKEKFKYAVIELDKLLEDLYVHFLSLKNIQEWDGSGAPN